MERPRLPSIPVPSISLPRLGRPSLPRPHRPHFRPLTFERLQGMSAPVGFFFYLLMFVAVVAIFAGATGTGLLMLFAGAGLHVFRSSVEELGAKRRRRAEHAARKREVRLRSHRTAQRRAREAKAAAAATPIPASSPEFRVTAAARAPRQRRRVSVR
jgi:hypothetical protein